MQNTVCILGMIIGFTAFVLGSYWWYRENRFDTFHPEHNRIFAVTTRNLSQSADGSGIEYRQLHRDIVDYCITNIPEIEAYGSMQPFAANYDVLVGGENLNLSALRVDTGFFALFYSDFIDGSRRGIPFDGSSAVLSAKTAKRLFGKLQCAGEIINKKDGGFLKVAGVIRDYPTNSEFVFDMLVLSAETCHNMNRTSFFIKLKNNVNVEAVGEKIGEIKSEIKTVRHPYEIEAAKKWSFAMRSLPDLHFRINPHLDGRFRNIRILAFAGLLAMISALMNYLVIHIGMQQKQRKKFLTMNSFGAPLSYHIIVETLKFALPVCVAIILSAEVIRLIFPVYQSYTQLTTKIEQGSLYAYFMAGLAAVLALSVIVSIVRVVVMLGNLHKKTPDTLKQILLTVQIFAGSFFLFISLSLYKQVSFMQNVDKGMNVANITQIDLGYDNPVDFGVLNDALRQNPLIEDVTFTTFPVLFNSGEYYGTHAGEIYPQSGKPTYEYWWLWIIERNFFDFFDIRFKEGRPAQKGLPEFVVNETAARALDKYDVLNTPFRDGGNPEIRITGIVGDYNYCPLQFPVSKIYYRYMDKESRPTDRMEQYQYAYVKIQPGNKTRAMEYVLATIDKLNGKLTGKDDVTELNSVLKQFSEPETVLFGIFGILSLACILIVSFGIYSLVSLTIEQRRKEVAIRKINGAEMKDIIRLFIREYVILVVVGNALALPTGYLLMSQWLESYAFHTSLNWLLFAIVFVSTGAIVLLSVFGKVKTAANENPAEVVNME